MVGLIDVVTDVARYDLVVLFAVLGQARHLRMGASGSRGMINRLCVGSNLYH